MHKAFIFGGQKKKLIKVKLWITFCPETEKKSFSILHKLILFCGDSSLRLKGLSLW